MNTPTIRQVINTSRLLVQLNRRQVSARRGVIISGASGTGKTTALTQLGRTHERHIRKRHPGDRHRLPGQVILFHRTVHPVVIREWSTPMESFSGAIWQSQRTAHRFTDKET